MVSVFDIADYILYFAYRRGDLVTNLKLQKLLYYIQAWFLVKNNGKALFKENIEAWQYGPVVKEVYDKYKCFGRNPINDDALPDNFDLSDEITMHIDSVLNNYMDYSAASLVNSIHQDDPWIEAFSLTQKPKIINLKSMYNFYKDRFLSSNDLKRLISTPLNKCITV